MEINEIDSVYTERQTKLKDKSLDTEEADYYPVKFSIKSPLLKTQLSDLQNILLRTDGTVTELLEYLSREPIVIDKIYQELERELASLPIAHRDCVNATDLPALVRKILLQGKRTRKNHIYAESTILLNNLPRPFRDELLYTRTPIGKLWSKHKLETYKTDFVATKERADRTIAQYLEIPFGSDLLSRTYSVYSCGLKSMVITEKFSATHFLE